MHKDPIKGSADAALLKLVRERVGDAHGTAFFAALGGLAQYMITATLGTLNGEQA